MLEAIAKDQQRILLTLATGKGRKAYLQYAAVMAALDPTLVVHDSQVERQFPPKDAIPISDSRIGTGYGRNWMDMS